MNDFAVNVTGWLFIAAALMLWAGRTFLPVKVGTFFEPKNFEEVYCLHKLWIWLYRAHIFGYLISVMALVAFSSLIIGSASQFIILPAVSVMSAGLIVSALAAAFYYHFGAWGAVSMSGKSTESIKSFVDSLHVGTEYITCLVRFGRVFFGLGQIVLALGLLHGEILPLWIILAAGVIGISAMAVTIGFPDNLEYYTAVFHLNSLWLLGMGISILNSGMSITI